MNPNKKPFLAKAKQPLHVINRAITAPQVRITGEELPQAGSVLTLVEALNLAGGLQLDLVLISPQANPPVCKIVDYKKFLFDQQKREKDQQRKQKETNKEQKEIRFTSNTGDNDVDTKKKKIREFLEEGHKVKLTVRFHGRNITYKDRGEVILLKIAEEMSELSKPDTLPKMMDRNMIMILIPKK